MRNLTQAPFLENQTIQSVEGDVLLTRRLREMGFRTGAEVRVLGRAPFKGPLVVQLDDGVMALRRNEAECLMIK